MDYSGGGICLLVRLSVSDCSGWYTLYQNSLCSIVSSLLPKIH